MEHYKSFEQLVENYKILPYPGRIYEHKIVSDNIVFAEYLVISSNSQISIHDINEIKNAVNHYIEYDDFYYRQQSMPLKFNIHVC